MLTLFPSQRVIKDSKGTAMPNWVEDEEARKSNSPLRLSKNRLSSQKQTTLSSNKNRPRFSNMANRLRRNLSSSLSPTLANQWSSQSDIPALVNLSSSPIQANRLSNLSPNRNQNRFPSHYLNPSRFQNHSRSPALSRFPNRFPSLTHSPSRFQNPFLNLTPSLSHFPNHSRNHTPVLSSLGPHHCLATQASSCHRSAKLRL